ncbi:PH domain-containing protein [Actinoplanes sp. URMC 104]|uniref:PH domain-containing protein n=1 Tax=Actinoplanes sp. URMC 104 TaxID=3423409 RepID=UPI003F1BD29E
MERIVIRPRIQVPLLVGLFAMWTFVGASYFIDGETVAKHDWFGVGLGVLCLITGPVGIWRGLRLGTVIDRTGIRVRNFDSRDQVIPWSDVRSVECAEIDVRGGLPLYGPVIVLDAVAFPVRLLGSYSRKDAQRKVEMLRGFGVTAETPEAASREGDGL